MEPPIVQGLIVGACALTAAVVAPIVAHSINNRGLQSLTKSRRSALAGCWKGNAQQEIGPQGVPLDYTVQAEITAFHKVVKGKATIYYKGPDTEVEMTAHLEGGFIHERFLRLEYANQDSAAIQFGSMVLELAADGRTLEGRFVGYGRITQTILTGSIKLQKTPA